jgi:serine/threonine protein kinase
VLRKLTVGAPAELYLAQDAKLGRRLTLKLLHADHNYDPRAARLLEREARLLGRVDHPNVARVYDLGRFGADLCMTLGVVGCDGLDQWLARGQPSQAAVLDVLRQAGEGLAAVHSVGVVHGDLTPRRVRVDERGHVVLVDFERAEDLHREPGAWEHDGPPVEVDPNYIAPETRATGLRDPLSDQYSFCALAWEALAGRRPPADPRQHAELREHRREPAYRALARGLAAAPTRRWPSMSELAAALAASDGGARRGWLPSLRSIYR